MPDNGLDRALGEYYPLKCNGFPSQYFGVQKVSQVPNVELPRGVLLTAESHVSKRPVRNRLTLAALILTVVFGAYFMLYLQGIPYEQITGVGTWYRSLSVSWGEMFGHLLNPVTARLTAVGRVLLEVRVTESMILKALYAWTADSVAAVAVYNTIVAVALALAVLWFATKFTGSVLAGFLCSSFLLTTAAYGWAVMEYGDFGPSDQLFILMFLGLFLHQFNQAIQGELQPWNGKRILGLALLWLLGMIAIRAKEPGRFLIPSISWALLLFNPSINLFRCERQRRRRNLWPLAAVAILLTLPIVLVKEAYAPEVTFSITDPFYWLFWNPQGWEPEKTSSLLTLRRSFPVSILSNYGFILAWAGILGGIALTVRWWKTPKGEARTPNASIPLLLALWALAGLALHAGAVNLLWTRYMTWDLLPIGFLFAICFVRCLDFFKGKTKTLIACVLVILVSYKIVDNVRHSLYIRQELESIWTPKWNFLTKVYQEDQGVQDESIFNVYKYWYLNRTDFTHKLEPFLYHKERLTLAEDREFAAILTEYGKAYVGSSHPLNLPWKAVLLKDLDAANLSWITSWKAKLTNKKYPHYLSV
jgi:hypothetical protein